MFKAFNKLNPTYGVYSEFGWFVPVGSLCSDLAFRVLSSGNARPEKKRCEN